jgi:hypothetical protein
LPRSIENNFTEVSTHLGFEQFPLQLSSAAPFFQPPSPETTGGGARGTSSVCFGERSVSLEPESLLSLLCVSAALLLLITMTTAASDVSVSATRLRSVVCCPVKVETGCVLVD